MTVVIVLTEGVLLALGYDTRNKNRYSDPCHILHELVALNALALYEPLEFLLGLDGGGVCSCGIVFVQRSVCRTVLAAVAADVLQSVAQRLHACLIFRRGCLFRALCCLIDFSCHCHSTEEKRR